MKFDGASTSAAIAQTAEREAEGVQSLLAEIIAERDKLQKRLDLVNVRCDARSKLEAQIYQLDARIAQRPQIERLAR